MQDEGVSAPTACFEKGGVGREPWDEDLEWPREAGKGPQLTASMKMGT